MTSSKCCKLYPIFLRCADKLQALFLLFVRLYWGWQFFVTGKGKLLNHDRVTEFFISLGIPFPELNAWIAGGVECFGGLLLLFGLGSRLAAIPLIFTMLVAYATAHSEALFNILNDSREFIKQEPFTFLMAAVIIFCFGPGPLSLDNLIRRRCQKNQECA